jgi:L-malate glycosyltransferase
MPSSDVKVLFIIDYFSGIDGGTERQMFELIRGLSGRGMAPRLILLRFPKITKDLQYFTCPVSTLKLPRMASLKTIFKMFGLAWFIRRENIRVVHVFFNDAAIVVPLFAKLGGAKVVASRRDMGTWYTRAALRVLPIANWFVDRIVANSRAVADHAIRLEHGAPAKFRVISNGYAFERSVGPALPGFRAELGLGPNDSIIGMVANLKPLKRHADALRALAIVRRTHPGAHLVILGTGRLLESLLTLARELKIEPYVHFVGNPPEVIPIVKHFNVGILCSESEGFSNALLEYMVCGVPPVCTQVGGNVELVKDGISGYLFPVGDVETMASRISMLLSDPELARNLGESARKTVQVFTVDAMVSAHVSLYSEMLARGGAN